MKGTTVTPLRKTKATLLTMEETEKAAGLIKVLGASRGYTRYSDLHTALAANGYPASYATFARFMRSVRPAQASELTPIARFFNLAPEDLTGAVENPLKDPAPPRLVEYDLPAPEAIEPPAPAAPSGVSRKPKASSYSPEVVQQVQALADSIEALTLAIRELTGTARRTPLQNVS